MKITHHPNAESLMSCSAGSMPENFAAVMSSHLTLCPQCQKELAFMESIGLALFDRLQSADIESAAPIMDVRASEADAEPAPSAPPIGNIPAPLLPVIGNDLDKVPWRRVREGVWQHVIPLRNRGRGELRLLKVAPGVALPEHAHRGSELTLVLSGAYNDETGRYGIGDVGDMAGDDAHTPVADPLEGCICLVATEGRLRFKGLLAKIFQPFTGI